MVFLKNKDPSPIVYGGGIDLKSETDIAKDEVKLRPCVRDARPNTAPSSVLGQMGQKWPRGSSSCAGSKVWDERD